MRVSQDNPIPGTLLVSVAVVLTLRVPWKIRRRIYRLVAAIEYSKDDVLGADVLVNPDIVLIDVVSPGGKLVVVGESWSGRALGWDID